MRTGVPALKRIPFLLLANACFTLLTLLLLLQQGAASAGSVPPNSDPSHATSPSAISEGRWTNLFPALHDVSAVSATEAWAVGDYGRLLHFASGTWQVMDPPALHGSSLFGISMFSPTSGWAVGTNKAFYYDGASWTEQSAGLENLQIGHLSASSADNAWVVGYNPTNSIYYTLRWSGTAWVDAAPPPPGSPYYFNDVQAISPTSVWVSGYASDPSRSLLLHYNGIQWTELPTAPTSAPLVNLYVISDNEIWVSRNSFNLDYDAMFRYKNGVWTTWHIDPPPLDDTNDAAHIYGIYMQNSNRGWAITDWAILGWNGSAWTPEYTGPTFLNGAITGFAGQIWAVSGGDTIFASNGNGSWSAQRSGPSTYRLTSVSMVSDTDVWAVGAEGTILHYDGSTWSALPRITDYALNGIHMLSATEGYAVGYRSILQWNGISWSKVYTPTSDLQAVYMTGSGNGWAVGSIGRAYKDVDGVWSPGNSGVGLGTTITGIYIPASGSGFMSTDDYYGDYSSPQSIFSYGRTLWNEYYYSSPDHSGAMNDVWLNSDGSEGWAVGEVYGTSAYWYPLLHFYDEHWHLEEAVQPSVGALRGLAAEADGNMVMVGCKAVYKQGTQWQIAPLPGSCLHSIAINPGNGGWAVGDNGTIMRYESVESVQRFLDVPVGSTFYTYIECMATRGIINGYPDNTFRPGNNITRGQLSKIVSESAGYTEDPGAQRFEDVPSGHTFYTWINRLNLHNVISGYACGGAGEPCGSGNLPYFRFGGNASRGQISKIVSESANYTDPPVAQLFEDVPLGSTFYDYAYRLASRGIMSGYPCGGPGEPCGPTNLPYFRSNANATRGQTAKIVTNTFFPSCSTR